MYKKLLIIISLLCTPVLCVAGPSINQLNSCLALVDFVDIKLSEFSDHYSQEDMATVHKGLSMYSQFLQNEVITPKLVSMYGGNETQAKVMQKLFDRQRKTFLLHLNERYTEQKLLTEYAASINQCKSNTRIRPDAAKALNNAMNTIIKMVKARNFN
ncbi:hypothetical protein J9B83_04650 [Marinomonas sp. A79]|uniref:Uncharacterized protein n=1 Tax=Marinomonas vulgaris TaxID=2823372 RepID=A0ABS5H9S2_9GAMM|nr:hypothetical protein [Marinomonas vulgaris]MBR7888225.1 hypothetical protein [Marinomonas vulgaris]